jgi:hypothetical protein
MAALREQFGQTLANVRAVAVTQAEGKEMTRRLIGWPQLPDKATPRQRDEQQMLEDDLEIPTRRYFRDLGTNAYAAFNAMADIPSHPAQNPRFRRGHPSMERMAGAWLRDFNVAAASPSFTIQGHLEELAGGWPLSQRPGPCRTTKRSAGFRKEPRKRLRAARQGSHCDFFLSQYYPCRIGAQTVGSDCPKRFGRGSDNPKTSGQALTEKTPPPDRRVGEAVAHVQVSPKGVAKGPRARLVTGYHLPGHLEKSGWLVWFPKDTSSCMKTTNLRPLTPIGSQASRAEYTKA